MALAAGKLMIGGGWSGTARDFTGSVRHQDNRPANTKKQMFYPLYSNPLGLIKRNPILAPVVELRWCDGTRRLAHEVEEIKVSLIVPEQVF